MGWIRDITQCPRCGYEAALKEEHLSSWCLSIFCIRCGYSTERFFNHEKYESLRIDPCETDDNKREFEAQCWEREVICPDGSYICRHKGEKLPGVGYIEDGTIENLLEHLDEYDVCKYTFYKVRSWYIKDLLENTTTLFSEDKYHKCRDEDHGRKTGITTWSDL